MEHHTQIQTLVERLSEGDLSAREQLISASWERLLRMTRHISRDFAGVRRWEQTEDVWQNACLRIWKALEKVQIQDARHFLRLAAEKIRFELIDLARHHQGPRGHGRHHQTVTSSAGFSEEVFHKGMEDHTQAILSPSQQAEGHDLHQLIEQLPDALKEVFDLHYYHDLPQAEIAQLLGVDVRTVKRKWRAARLALQSKWQLWQAENLESFK